jgi:peptidoglycan/LPS O-acetylase OafA/YrhL
LSVPADGRAARREVRPDIQAMRAIAVVAVFAYHLWPSRLPGGFVGVDIFFVISGFLIAGALMREAEATGTIDVRRFWGRRIRRLLPASLLVLGLTSVAVCLWIPANLWPQFLREVIASTAYVQNWVLAGDAVDYLAANNLASPVQHFWTLSVEEQFYVFTPIVLGLLLLVARRPGLRRPILVGGLAAISVLSFGYSVWLTAVDAPAAYFVTTTRAWEFGVGALVSVLPRAPVGWLSRGAVATGLFGVASAVALMSSEDPFPGAVAAWPVLASALLIWAGPSAGTTWRRLTALRPLQYVGDISYAVYLWHWPLIVIPTLALGQRLNGTDKLLVIALTVAAAGLSTRYVENPLRNRQWSLGSLSPFRAAVAAGAAGMAAVVVIAGAGLLIYEVHGSEADDQARSIMAESADCLGAVAALNADRCIGRIPASVLIPDPAHAGADDSNLSECWAGVSASTLNVCSFGPPDATVRLAAIGDSHSNSLVATYRGIAERLGWRIDVAGHNGCYWTAAIRRNPVQATVDACEAWKQHVVDWLNGGMPYDAILVTMARHGSAVEVAAGDAELDGTVRGLLDAWASQTARGTRIIALRDNPLMRSDVVRCVVLHRDAANDFCAQSEDVAVGTTDALVEAIRQTRGARLVDLTDIYCPDHVCEAVIGHVVVYQNRDHVTGTWATSLVIPLSDRLAAALGR